MAGARAPGHTPWMMAGAFGLVHGLGFAGALAEFGLERSGIVSALLWFNVGVELGQIAVVVALAAVTVPVWRWLGDERWRGDARWRSGTDYVHRAACVGLGGVAAYWCLDRISAIVGA